MSDEKRGEDVGDEDATQSRTLQTEAEAEHADDAVAQGDEMVADDSAEPVEEPHPETEHHDEHVDSEHLYADEHELEEEHARGMSWSARALTLLVLLLGGAGLGLWGGPKIAPMLPGWAAPVAAFLTPGANQVQADVDALRTDISTRLDNLDTGPDSDAVARIAAEAAQSAEDRIAQRLDEMANAIAAAENGDIEARIGALESRLDGAVAELNSLSDTLQGVAVSGGELSETAMADIASNAAEMDALRAQVESLSGQYGSLTQKIGVIAEDVERKAEDTAAMERATGIQLALDKLANAAISGRSFVEELEAATAAIGTDAPAVLTEAASVGVASIKTLRSEFAPVAHAAIRQDVRAAADDGTLSRVSGFFKSQIATRSLEPQEGDSTDAILSRIEAALTADDLALVMREAAGLSDSIRPLLDDWLAKVEQRQSVLSAIDALAAQPS